MEPSSPPGGFSPTRKPCVARDQGPPLLPPAAVPPPPSAPGRPRLAHALRTPQACDLAASFSIAFLGPVPFQALPPPSRSGGEPLSGGRHPRPRFRPPGFFFDVRRRLGKTIAISSRISAPSSARRRSAFSRFRTSTSLAASGFSLGGLPSGRGSRPWRASAKVRVRSFWKADSSIPSSFEASAIERSPVTVSRITLRRFFASSDPSRPSTSFGPSGFRPLFITRLPPPNGSGRNIVSQETRQDRL